MGSGSSSGFCHSGTKQESDADSFEMDLRVRELEERASHLESLLREAEGQVAQMKKEVDARDKKIDSLLREIHKLKLSCRSDEGCVGTYFLILNCEVDTSAAIPFSKLPHHASGRAFAWWENHRWENSAERLDIHYRSILSKFNRSKQKPVVNVRNQWELEQYSRKFGLPTSLNIKALHLGTAGP
ncbi:hypothetical protein AVEN_223817-1 [Araneus ventricosus]|uniref:Uncharacterized protein n=1 Tax=Araneus ventricosus TaxID=182803 RepID=A0A4Y2SAY5_ARAVE|nr:hypothetical protein AVEN_223817-1 [Araneus ventricosus]